MRDFLRDPIEIDTQNLQAFIRDRDNAIAHHFFVKRRVGEVLPPLPVKWVFLEKIIQNSDFLGNFTQMGGYPCAKIIPNEGYPPLPTSFFTKRGAQMYYIQKSHTRTFQNTHNY